MKVGILIHSITGNTLQVGEKLKKKLGAKGHKVTLERISAEDEKPASMNDIVLSSNPSPDTYDLIILGAPVHAFTLSMVMKVYLNRLSSLKGKKVFCFVTQSFPKPWLGGNRAIKAMKKLCTHKDSIPLKTGIVNWNGKARKKQIEDIVRDMSDI